MKTEELLSQIAKVATDTLTSTFKERLKLPVEFSSKIDRKGEIFEVKITCFIEAITATKKAEIEISQQDIISKSPEKISQKIFDSIEKTTKEAFEFNLSYFFDTSFDEAYFDALDIIKKVQEENKKKFKRRKRRI